MDGSKTVRTNLYYICTILLVSPVGLGLLRESFHAYDIVSTNSRLQGGKRSGNLPIFWS